MRGVPTDSQFSEITRKPQTLALIPFGESPTGIDKAKLLVSVGGCGATGDECFGGGEGVVDGDVAKVVWIAGIVLLRCDA